MQNRFKLPLAFNGNVVFCALLAAWYFMPDYHPKLLFSDLQQIGEATMKREDIAARVSNFYTYVLAFFGTGIIASLLAGISVFKTPEKLRPWYAALSFCGSLLTLSAFWLPELLHVAWGILLIEALTLPFQYRLAKQTFPLIRLFTILLLCLLVWQQFTFIFPEKPDALLHTALISFSYVSCLWFLPKISISSFLHIIQRFWPVFFLALVPFKAVELRYFIQVRFGIDSAPLFLWCVLVGLVGLLCIATRNFRISASRALTLSALLLSCGLVIHQFYVPYGPAPTEMYELANRILPLQELHFFRTVPLLEKASSHFVSDYGFGLIYQALFGYHGLDFLVFDILEYIVWIALVFLLVSKLSRSRAMATMVCIAFPFTDAIFSLYYMPALIPFLALLRLQKRDTVQNRWVFGLSAVLLVPWRADLTVAYLPALMLCTLLVLSNKRVHPIKWVMQMGLSVVLFGLICLGVSMMANIPWVDNLKSSLDYLISSQSYGLLFMGDENHFQWKVHHLLLPLITAAVGLYAFTAYWKISETPKRRILLTLLFLSIFSIINIPRGLVRHGFAESTDNFLLSLSLISIPFAALLHVKHSAQQRTIFALSLWAILAIWIRFPERLPALVPLSAMVEAKFNAREIGRHNALQRLSTDSAFYAKQIEPIVTFLKEELKEGETFFDFTNTPMLHYYAAKEVPSFFYQNPQNVHSASLQDDWIARFPQWDCPLILFKHDPPNWWDATDGVSNEVRHGLMANYIRRNYRFYTKTGGYEIWKRKAKR
jgi:hypothetical protein